MKKEGCPPWSIQADEIFHDKKRQTINYKNAKLKIYDVPVLYFPRFFHPDPTVNRQSGFLPPTISSQKFSELSKLPYFFAISNYSDFTFSPTFLIIGRIYIKEYRHVTKIQIFYRF